MKQTAVEWLVEQWPILESQLPDWLIEQAKAMEKEQIIEAYEYTTVGTSHYGEQYYNKTYESNT